MPKAARHPNGERPGRGGRSGGHETSAALKTTLERLDTIPETKVKRVPRPIDTDSGRRREESEIRWVTKASGSHEGKKQEWRRIAEGDEMSGVLREILSRLDAIERTREGSVDRDSRGEVTAPLIGRKRSHEGIVRDPHSGGKLPLTPPPEPEANSDERLRRRARAIIRTYSGQSILEGLSKEEKKTVRRC